MENHKGPDFLKNVHPEQDTITKKIDLTKVFRDDWVQELDNKVKFALLQFRINNLIEQLLETANTYTELDSISELLYNAIGNTINEQIEFVNLTIDQIPKEPPISGGEIILNPTKAEIKTLIDRINTVHKLSLVRSKLNNLLKWVETEINLVSSRLSIKITAEIKIKLEKNFTGNSD